MGKYSPILKLGEIGDLASWEPGHPKGTRYFFDAEAGKLKVTLPDGTVENYSLLKDKNGEPPANT
jgi:hypothetical protein